MRYFDWQNIKQIHNSTKASPEKQVEYLNAVIKAKTQEITNLELQLQTEKIKFNTAKKEYEENKRAMKLFFSNDLGITYAPKSSLWKRILKWN